VPATKVFVFGSNLAGRHGKGAAKDALLLHGAVYGESFGHFGNSFAIPTRDRAIRTLPLPTIAGYVSMFLVYATMHEELTFQVTRIGCGLAGYTDLQIAPMFKHAPPNCELPKGWRSV